MSNAAIITRIIGAVDTLLGPIDRDTTYRLRIAIEDAVARGTRLEQTVQLESNPKPWCGTLDMMMKQAKPKSCKFSSGGASCVFACGDLQCMVEAGVAK